MVSRHSRLTATILIAALVLGLGARSHTAVDSGLVVVVKVEARRLASTISEPIERTLAAMFPRGEARVEYITDGRSVRATSRGEMAGLAEGTVRLALAGQSDILVLNIADKTYGRLGVGAGQHGTDAPTVVVRSVGDKELILGYKATRVLISFRDMWHVTASPGRVLSREVTADIDSWCTNELAVPATMTRMMDMADRLLQGRVAEYRDACPLPLKSTVLLSVLPDVALVSTVESIRRLPEVPSGVLDIPLGFREAPRSEQVR